MNVDAKKTELIDQLLTYLSVIKLSFNCIKQGHLSDRNFINRRRMLSKDGC